MLPYHPTFPKTKALIPKTGSGDQLNNMRQRDRGKSTKFELVIIARNIPHLTFYELYLIWSAFILFFSLSSH
jgi:hypothetical protein